MSPAAQHLSYMDIIYCSDDDGFLHQTAALRVCSGNKIFLTDLSHEPARRRNRTFPQRARELAYTTVHDRIQPADNILLGPYCLTWAN